MPQVLVLATWLLLSLTACDRQEPTKHIAANKHMDATERTSLPRSGSESFTVMVSGSAIGHLRVENTGTSTSVDYEYRENGRGPTIHESIEFSGTGLPVSWKIEGNSTFGNEINETFTFSDGNARWRDASGTGSALASATPLYAAQAASPYALWIYARALMNEPKNELAILPGGKLRLKHIENLTLDGSNPKIKVASYSLGGIRTSPSYILLDTENAFFAMISPRFAIIREGYEAADAYVRNLADQYAAKRFESIQTSVAKNLGPVFRISDVRIFDPIARALGEPVSVQVRGNRISAILTPDAPLERNETSIDGAGGTLVAGMNEMHIHLDQNSALLNIAAGITSVRDMGSNNEILSGLIQKIESGRLAGPRVNRSGFIEGKSPYNSILGELVSSEQEAVAAVQKYATGDYHQIKIYNSVNPKWVPAMVREAHEAGMRVAGHVPAFSNADAMIAAGYDELTHINQVMLGWVLEDGEDTRSLLRLTALRRLASLDLKSPRVLATIDAMAERSVAIDPTLAIHETLLRSRNGTVSPGTVDYIDHMPIAVQRASRTAMAEIASQEDDDAYWQAFDKIIETLKIMRRRGISLVPGTDQGGSLAFHRELELYQKIGMTPPEILAWASYGMARYLGQSDELGSIETEKLADFFLVPGDPTTNFSAIKTISMVVKDGTVYFPSDIYPHFGIEPFVAAPKIKAPQRN